MGSWGLTFDSKGSRKLRIVTDPGRINTEQFLSLVPELPWTHRWPLSMRQREDMWKPRQEDPSLSAGRAPEVTAKWPKVDTNPQWHLLAV